MKYWYYVFEHRQTNNKYEGVIESEKYTCFPVSEVQNVITKDYIILNWQEIDKEEFNNLYAGMSKQLVI